MDVLASLSVVAERNNYVRPKINKKGVIDIKNGRHPVVEKMINNDMFIANDTYLDNGKQPDFHYYRTEHGRKIHLYASDCPDRADGTDWMLCSGRQLQRSVSWTGSLPVSELPMTWPADRVPLWWR